MRVSKRKTRFDNRSRATSQRLIMRENNMTTSNTVVTVKAAKVNEKAENAKSVFINAAQNFAETKNAALQKSEIAETIEEKNSFAKTAKTAQTHERYNDALASMSEKALASLSKYKVDAEALSKQARELKKRSIAILEALATQTRVNDRALDAVLNYIVAKNAASMTLEQVRHEMQHETTTQAQYFKTCAVFFNFAQYSKSDKSVTFNKEAHVLRDLLKIYTVTV